MTRIPGHRSEQIRVRSRADEVDVAVAKMPPVAAERVVLALRGNGLPSISSKMIARNFAMSLPRFCASFTSRWNCVPRIGFRKD